jgi:hypothetical protein
VPDETNFFSWERSASVSSTQYFWYMALVLRL